MKNLREIKECLAPSEVVDAQGMASINGGDDKRRDRPGGGVTSLSLIHILFIDLTKTTPPPTTHRK